MMKFIIRGNRIYEYYASYNSWASAIESAKHNKQNYRKSYWINKYKGQFHLYLTP